ncbi:MAG TPA: response regulator transcription factor [Firmicutes bacterium]|nr:response regulator transcription factor [Bacillota bacterium]
MGSKGSSVVRVLVVHQDLFAAQTMALALGDTDGLAGRACLADPQLAVAEARAWPADVAIVAMPEGCPVAEILKREAEGVRVLGLASGQQAIPASSLQELGLAGMIPDSVDIPGIVAAVRAVASGYVIVPQPGPGRAGRRNLRGRTSDAIPDGSGLTSREREIVGLAVQGLTDRDIARVFGVSLSHVRARLKGARAKTGARTRMQLVGLAIRQGGIR